MEIVNPVLLSMVLFCRSFFSMSPETANDVCLKAIEVAGPNADVVDLCNALDDVWAASLAQGTITWEHIDDVVPTHPIEYREQLLMQCNNASEIEHIKKTHPEKDGVVRPKRYKDKNLSVVKKNRIKKSRHWDNNSK